MLLITFNSCIVIYVGEGVDYNSGPYSVTFPTGVTAVSFNVSINNDNILEGNEEFILNINNASLPDNVVTNNSGTATVTISDDDSKFLLHKNLRYMRTYVRMYIGMYVQTYCMCYYLSHVPWIP